VDVVKYLKYVIIDPAGRTNAVPVRLALMEEKSSVMV
jgi:hypothetical protein